MARRVEALQQRTQRASARHGREAEGRSVSQSECAPEVHDCLTQSARRIHEPVCEGLATGPHASLREPLKGFERLGSGCRHFLHEVDVQRIDIVHQLRLFFGPPLDTG